MPAMNWSFGTFAVCTSNLSCRYCSQLLNNSLDDIASGCEWPLMNDGSA